MCVSICYYMSQVFHVVRHEPYNTGQHNNNNNNRWSCVSDAPETEHVTIGYFFCAYSVHSFSKKRWQNCICSLYIKCIKPKNWVCLMVFLSVFVIKSVRLNLTNILLGISFVDAIWGLFHCPCTTMAFSRNHEPLLVLDFIVSTIAFNLLPLHIYASYIQL